MGAGYLLDTNTIIDLSAKKLPDNSFVQLSNIIDTAPQISVINKIELLSFNNVQASIVAFTDAAFVITLDDEIIAKTIELRKKYKIKLPDAIIAATALVFNLVLITHNVADFKNIKGLNLIDPYLDFSQ